MESRELCIRCGKPTLYDINTPIMRRRYFVEGYGQLCEKCFYELYPVPGSLQSDLDVDNITMGKDSNTDYIPNKL